MKEKLESLIHDKGVIKDEVKDKIIKDFCESFYGEGWFMELSIPMIMTAFTELLKGIRETNPDVIRLDIVNGYYREGIECLEFPWASCQRLANEELAAEFEEENKESLDNRHKAEG